MVKVNLSSLSRLNILQENLRRSNIMGDVHLNENFFEKLLRECEGNQSIIITRIEKDPACEVEESFSCQVNKIQVCGFDSSNTREYTKKLIVKKMPHEEHRELYRSHISMENEINAYTKILPALKSYIDGDFSLANCIYADKCIIILEDLCEKGFQAVQKRNGLNVEQCILVLQELAKLHAASLIMQEKNPQLYKKLLTLVKEPLFWGGDSRLFETYKQISEIAIDLFSKLPLSEETQNALTVLNEIKENVSSTLKQFLLQRRAHSVICHGDMWCPNIMFNDQNELKLIDFGTMRYNSIASDLCYLLYINLDPPTRLENQEMLLDQYWNSLLRYTKDQEVYIDNVITKTWLSNEMEIFGKFGFIYALWILPAFYINKEHAKNISQNEIGDTAHRILRAESQFHERLKQLVLSYTKNVPK